MPTVIHLRADTKPFERRSPLSPKTAKALLDAGYTVRVERSAERIYNDEEFVEVGAELVPAGSWVKAPKEDIIFGLKELPEDDIDLPHTYIHFQHIFKKQTGWAPSLSRFARAGVLHPGVTQGEVPLFENAPALVSHVKSVLEPAIAANNGQAPRIIVIGALGRCGSGAVQFCREIGLDEESIIKWDMAETAKGGPFKEVVESDIFVNCVYLGPNPAPPFVTFDSLATPERRLRVICDVSCDPNSPNNPIPIYSTWSTFDKPTIPTSKPVNDPELRIIAIDHLPTLIPRESSDEYSGLLLPALLTLDRRDTEGVWTRAEATYKDRVTLRTLRAANSGEKAAMESLISKGFGRSGSRRRELMAQFVIPQGPKDSSALEEALDSARRSNEASKASSSTTHATTDSTGKVKKAFFEKWDQQKLMRILQSQRQQQRDTKGTASWPGTPVKTLDPDQFIPKETIWGKPPGENLKQTKRANWWRRNADKIMPPLGRGEWEMLKELSNGGQERGEWQIPERRPLANSLAATEERTAQTKWNWEDYATKPTAIVEKPRSLKQQRRTGQKDSGPYSVKDRDRNLSTRWFQRAYTRAWQLTPTMTQDPNTLKYSFTWGSIQSRLPPAAKHQLDIFKGVDENGRKQQKTPSS
ncbi:hypothetical protein TsFJ059_007835 [Trichoderma semiorbis]|uniref:Saccharopine dehydrogenase [NAD(+), L-lysine-forming] n=1 Tax=Trichoderma semiorbis TaxID=1491008 RepID=A0A9P8KNQ6_9HYPO|nr:hypothetical protein TsFJ059_007835 [Trichoderma semiorbis]